MRTLGRTLVIILAALLVAGAAYALGSAGLIGATTGGMHGGHGPGGGEAFAVGEIVKNLGIIAAIVALVVGGSALAKRIRPAPQPSL
ncbi:hypothetical protein K2Z83_00995 [Oscillochloris sp. ZM17-4]|uniref:hypothetical protein n=1 Tax=Oscillochloris sp. ZM17-4 TaxID=2866714 RepID=UPI001C72E7FB|nr:hypothetical protein [Oscillochloris sp. ZM17-4]MBX0326270.1 hypothetical protein [Oscillochloris sp. ZM17-4]